MIALIVAYDQNRLIGANNQLPWHFKEDLAYFKRVTMNHTCVMGRKTFESIMKTLKKPLPNRKNVVVSSKDLAYDGIEIIRDPVEYFQAHQDTEKVIFVIGGRALYKTALPYVKRLYITHIDETFTGDTYFPTIDFTKYQRIYYDAASKPLAFAIYERVK